MHTRTRQEIETQNERQVHMSLNSLVRTTTRLVFWFAIYTPNANESREKMRQRQNSSKCIRESYSINSSCNWLIKQKKGKWMLSWRKSGNAATNRVVSTAIPNHWKYFNHSIRIWRWHSNSFVWSWPVDCVASIRSSIHWTQLRNQFGIGCDGYENGENCNEQQQQPKDYQEH